jgi:hypothetical protein
MAGNDFRITRMSAELQALSAAEQRQADSEKALAHYREPFARAAYDLQSRLYNILEQNLLSNLRQSQRQWKAHHSH